MPPVITDDPAADALIQAYSDAWDAIQIRMRRLIDDPRAQTKRARLAEMRDEIARQMAALDDETDGYVRNSFPDQYAAAMNSGYAEVAPDPARFVFTQADRQAATLLGKELLTDLTAARLQVEESTRTLIRKIGRDSALQAVLQGDTARQASREMRRLLASDGIHAVTYANGARHGLKSYAEMVVRSQTAIAYNTAVIHGMEQGTDTALFIEVFDGPSCGWEYHDSPRRAAGLILSPVEAAAFPISHPNCRRAFGYRPDIETKEQADQASSSVATGQEQAQVAQDTARGLPTRAEMAARRQALARGATPDLSRATPVPGLAAVVPRLQKALDRPVLAARRAQTPVPARAVKAQQRAEKAQARVATPQPTTGGQFPHLTPDEFEVGYRAAGLPEPTATQLDAIQRYTVGLYREWNKRLREGGTETKPIKAARAAMQPLPQPVTVARTLNLGAFGVDDRSQASIEAGIRRLVGQQIQDEGFLSTSLNTKEIQGRLGPNARMYRGEVYMEIEVPAGTRSIWAEPHTMMKGENELILDRGTRLEITGVELTPQPAGDIAGKWATVRARVVPQEQPAARAVAKKAAAPPIDPDSMVGRYGGKEGTGVAHRQAITSGQSGAAVDLVTLDDGSQLIYKGRDGRKEYLTTRVAEAFNTLVAKVERIPGATTTQLQELVPGPMGRDWWVTASAQDRNGVVFSGRDLGLMDTVIRNNDRHTGNWILHEEWEVPVGIDSGAAKYYSQADLAEPHRLIWRPADYRRDPSVFAQDWTKIGEAYDAIELREIRANVEALRPEFEREKVGHWVDGMLVRLDSIIRYHPQAKEILGE